MAKDQSDFRALLHRYQQGDCTRAEQQRVEQWYSDLGAARSMPLTDQEKTALVATVWERITSQTKAAGPTVAPVRQSHPLELAPEPRLGRWLAWTVAGGRWAAMALLTLAAGAVGTYTYRHGEMPQLTTLWQPENGPVANMANWLVYANNSAYEARVALPDGSAVTLAPTSTLKYPRTFGGTPRAVYLTGEAFFDVFHDANHPFLVYTDQVVTTVLGTRFRVRTVDGQAQVQVQSGAVRVAPRNAQAGSLDVVVRPNQQAVYSATHRRFRRELVAQPALLAPQSFVFNDRPAAEVLTTLANAYGIAIEYDAMALRGCTLTLNLSRGPLFDKLNTVCEVLGARYEKTDGHILFHSQPCQVE